MSSLPETALYRYLVIWICATGCASGAARAPASTAESAPTAVSPARGRWLLHGEIAGPVAAGGLAVSYLSTWLGPEHMGQTVRLPSAYSVSFSPDGKWLALCSPDPSGAQPSSTRRASVIRFEAERISEPLVVGACQALEWAPTGAHLLLESDSDWKLIELGGAKPVIRELGAGLETPVTWSPSGRYLVASERNVTHALALVSLLEAGLPPQPLQLFGLPRGACSWSGADALACTVERQGKHELMLDQVGAPSVGPEPYVTELTSPLTWLGWATNRVVAYELSRAGGVYAFGEGLAATRLFEPASSYGLDYFRLSPTGRWLLDCAGQGARLWDLAGVPRSVPLPGLSSVLVNPRWSSNGRHALLGVRHPQYGSQQTDVWLVSEASTEPKLARLTNLAPGRQSFASFSPGSSWVLVSVAPDTPTPAAETRLPAAAEPTPTVHFALNVAAHAERTLPLGFGEWAPDDSAFVVSHDARLLAFRVRGSDFVGPEDLGSTGSGTLRLVWQP